MRWPEKQRAWAWRQVRLIRTVAETALAADPAQVNPEAVLETIFEIATVEGDAVDREKDLTAFEQQYGAAR